MTRCRVADEFDEGFAESGVGEDGRRRGECRGPGHEVGGDSPRLCDKQEPGGHIPWSEVELPESVEPAARHPR